MTIVNNPTLVENDSAEPMYPRGSGAKAIVVIGDAGVVADDPNVVYEFVDYAGALSELGPEASANPLLAAIKDVFIEGSIFNVSLDKLGIEKVYAINIRTSATPAVLTQKMWTDAMTLSETKADMQMVELYAGCYTVAVMKLVRDHILALRLTGLKRASIFTIDPTKDLVDDKTDIFKMTDSSETTFINDGTVSIHTNPKMQAAYAAKCACTEHFMDPAYKSYRSKTMEDIIEIGRQLADDYTGAGFVVDGPSINPDFVGKPEPMMAVTTSYRIGPGGTRPTDAFLHHRFNVDYQSVETNKIALGMIKKNNTITSRAMVEQSCIGFLQNEVSLGNLQAKTSTEDGKPADDGFFLEIKTDPLDPFKLIKNMKVRPVGSVHMIVDNEIIQAPAAGGA